jgi:hypothetical protein
VFEQVEEQALAAAPLGACDGQVGDDVERVDGVAVGAPQRDCGQLVGCHHHEPGEDAGDLIEHIAERC